MSDQSNQRSILEHIYRAIRTNDVSRLQTSLPKLDDINTTLDTFGTTPLQTAASFEAIDCLSQLLEAGADVTRTDQQKWSALHYAASSGSVQSIKKLVAAGAALEAPDCLGRTPLLTAANSGRLTSFRSIQALIACGADPRAVDSAGWTAIAIAAQNRSEESVRQLFDVCPDADASEASSHVTALQVAASMQLTSCIRMLAESWIVSGRELSVITELSLQAEIELALKTEWSVLVNQSRAAAILRDVGSVPTAPKIAALLEAAQALGLSSCSLDNADLRSFARRLQPPSAGRRRTAI